MSGVERRTVFYNPGDALHGRWVRWIDWARVDTKVGTCFEPWEMVRWMPGENSFSKLERDDDIGRIDAIEGVSREWIKTVHFCDEDPDNKVRLHGGYMYPLEVPL